MKREIKPAPAVVEFIPVDGTKPTKDWLQNQAAAYKLEWLLAHADDGIIWGELREGKLVTSDEVAPDVSPPLRAETLQQVRLFSERGELLLWRDGDNQWHARLLRQTTNGELPDFTEAIDEPQMLWGTQGEHITGFTSLREGEQGFRHVVPMQLPLIGHHKETKPPLLWVRHYVGDDDTGFTRIIASRLFDLKLEGI